MPWTLTQSGSAISKVGKTISGALVKTLAEAGDTPVSVLERWSNQAEGNIIAETRRDWITDYSSLKTEVKSILEDTASSFIAMRILNYYSNEISARELETKLDFLRDNLQSNISFLKDFKSNEIRSV